MENQKLQLTYIDPAKLKAARGSRSMDDIVHASDGAFSKATYRAWELGLWYPQKDKIPALVKALGVPVDQLISPLEIAA